MNAIVSQHRFWHCHENGLIKTFQTIPHNLHGSVKTYAEFGIHYRLECCVLSGAI